MKSVLLVLFVFSFSCVSSSDKKSFISDKQAVRDIEREICDECQFYYIKPNYQKERFPDRDLSEIILREALEDCPVPTPSPEHTPTETK